jgi:lysophospholipase L1-like esterase
MHKYAKQLKQQSMTPGLTHEHKPNSEAKLMRVNVAFNGLGFRDDFIPHNKKENEYRILVTGSSITMGWGVTYDSVYTNLLEKKLNNRKDGLHYDVVNTGIGNYNTVMEAIYLEKNIQVVHPNKVILHFFLNDVEFISKRNESIFIEYSYLAAYLYVRLKQSIFGIVSNYSSIGEYYLEMYKNTSRGWNDTQDSIIKMKNMCKSKGIEFMVLIQPDLHNFSLIIRNFLEDNNINYLDLFDAYALELKDNPGKIWVNPDDPHPNSTGHKIIFNNLLKYLNEN